MPFFLPDFSGAMHQWVALVFVFAAPLFFLIEATGWLPFGYSKFARRDARFAMPSRVGMFLLYFPATILYPLIHVATGAPNEPGYLVAMALVTLHFGKRCLETLFVHRYSGVMNLDSVVIISGLYVIVSWILAASAGDLLAAPGFGLWGLLGLGLWTLGILGNAYHHRLLANLRAPGETEYKVPVGGLFRWVACPHYTFELLSWWGLCLFFQHAAAYVLALTMTCYLAGRAYATLRWYRQKVPAALADWRRLVPGIY